MNPSYAIGVFVYKHEQDANKLGRWPGCTESGLDQEFCHFTGSTYSIHTTVFLHVTFVTPKVGWAGPESC